MICKICNKEINNYGFPSHLKCLHNMTTKEYYDKYLKEEDEGICPICGKPTNFKGLHKGGYFKFCSTTCSALYTQNREEVRNKQKDTLLQNHGVTCALNICSNEYKYEQTKNAILKKYNVENIFQDKNIINEIQLNKQKDFDEFEKENNCIAKTKICKLYGTGWNQNEFFEIEYIKYKNKYFISNEDIDKIYDYYISHEKFSTSEPEKQILQIIKNNYSGKIITHSRKIIKPKELDIYLPDIKLAIEYNSNYFHSIENNTPKDYHLNKSLRCKELGIRLIHIYEFEDFNNELILIQQLLNGIDNYPKNNPNKNNLIYNFISDIIYKDNRYNIYGLINSPIIE